MNFDRTLFLSRRTLLKSALSTLFPLTTVASTTSFADVGTQKNLYISGARQAVDQHVAVLFDEAANVLATIPLSARAHGAATHAQSHRVSVFGRRPGYFINTFDIRSPSTQHIVSPADGRHFYGHGTYSEDGNLLYATENDYDNARGVIGIYDALQSYKRIGEFSSYGTGPHEIVQVPNSALLVVANGGIQTHPDSGREKLNIGTMQPSLVIIDSRNGRLVGRHLLAHGLQQVSIRHIACTQEGELWYAGQYEGEKPSTDGLAGRVLIRASVQSYKNGVSHRGLTMVGLPESVKGRAQGYLSSVAIVGRHAVYTCAKGGFAFMVNRNSLQVDESLSILDCSGVAMRDFSESVAGEGSTADSLESALITSGIGEVVSVTQHGVNHLVTHRLQWDNHLYRV